ncbi:MAG: hypothetical protein ACFB4I_18410 [Cyanophyceae cyanobacterium]
MTMIFGFTLGVENASMQAQRARQASPPYGAQAVPVSVAQV